jgi:hypothetical protein
LFDPHEPGIRERPGHQPAREANLRAKFSAILDPGRCFHTHPKAYRTGSFANQPAAINRAVRSDFFKERYAQIGDEPAGGTPEEFAALIKKESAKWAEVVKRSGAKLD